MSIKAKAKRRVIILITCLLMAGAAVGGLFAYKHHKDRKLLATARQVGMNAVSEGNYPVAVSNLAYYLSVYPDDLEVLSAYVQARPTVISDNYAHISDTLRRLQHILDLDPTRVAARRQLMTMNARFGRMTEAMANADALLAQVPNDPQGLEIKVQCLERLHRYKEALAIATNRWTKAAPDDPQPPLTVLSLMQLSGARSGEIMDWAKANCGKMDSLRGQMVMALACDYSGDPKTASSLLQSAASTAAINPPSAATTRSLVRMLDNQGMYSQSLSLLERISKSQNDVTSKRALVRRLWEAGRWQVVVDLTESITADLAKDRDRTSRMVSREFEGTIEMAAMRALALTNLKRDADAQAVRSAMSAVGQGPIETAWLALLDHEKDPSANPKKLLDACRKAINAERNFDDVANPYLQFELANAYSQLGEYDLAITELKAIQNATWGLPMIRLADLELSRGRIALAMTAAQEGARRAPSSSIAATTLARCWSAAMESGQLRTPPEKLLESIAAMRKELPDNEELIQSQVSMLAKSGNLDEAKKSIQDILAENRPFSEAVLLRLAALSRLYNLGLADACYARSEHDHGVTPELAYAKAITLFSGGQGEQGLKSLQADRQNHGQSDDLSWALACSRYLDVIRDSSAKSQWMALGDKYPNNLSVQQMVMASPSLAGERDFLDKTIQRMKALTSEDALSWRMARARWLLQGAKTDQDLTQASLLLKDILRVSGDQADAHVLLAQCYEKLRDVPGALEELNAASALDPQSSGIALYRARLLQKQGQFDKARDELDRVIASGSINEKQQKEVAVMLAQQGDAQRAVDLMQKLGHAGSDTMLMAVLYRQQGQFDKAEAVCRKILAENPDPMAVQFMADLLASQGRADEAEKVLAMLDHLSLKPGLKELIIADHYARFVGPDQGEKMFQSATRVAPQDATTWKALISFELVAGHADSAKAAIADAAQALPNDKAIQAIRGESETLLFAMQQPELKTLLQPAMSRADAGGPDVQAMQLIRELRGGSSAKDALDRLQKLADANLENMPIQILLAREYMAAGRLDDAMAVAARAVQAFPTEPRPAELAVEIYTRGGRWSEMMGYAHILHDRLGADKLQADIAIALASHNLQHPRPAVDQLAPYISRMMKTPDRYQSALLLYAADLCLTGQGATAENLIWPLALKSAQWRTGWIYMTNQNPIAQQADQELEKVAPLLGPDENQNKLALARAWHDLATRAKDSRYLNKGLRVLEEMAKLPDADAAVFTGLGEFQEDQGNVDGAIASYHRALAMPSGNKFVARNNLAMILARRGKGDDLKESLTLAQAAVAEAPKLATLYDTLAFVQEQAKDYDSAAKTMQLAINLDRQNPIWWLRLGEICATNGHRKEAAGALAEIDRMPTQNLDDAHKARLEALRSNLAHNRVAQTSAG